MPPGVKEMLRDRVDRVTEPETLGVLMQKVLGERAGSASEWANEIIQLDSTGAATLKFDGPDGVRVFGKIFPPHIEGEAIFQKILKLRAEGFGPPNRYQAVEFVEYFPEWDMVLAMAAPGTAVSEWICVDDEKLVHGVREAAAFLAALHTSPHRIGRPHTLLVSGELLSLARRLAKTVMERPEWNETAQEMIVALEDLSLETNEGLLVQTHGQYRPIHVFVSDDTTTVIDLDRSRPCDPARDLAEFVHRLRTTGFGKTGTREASDAAVYAFLDTYVANVPQEYLANFRFHLARYVFHSLNRKLKGGNDRETAGLVDFYTKEFEDAVAGRHHPAMLP